MILGIDPGLSGAFAWLDDDGELVDIADMPAVQVGTKHRIVPALVADLVLRHKVTMCWLENVHAMKGQGVSSMFSFGRSLGVVEGVLAALECPVTYVAPNVWTKSMGVGADKGVHAQRACQLWPAMADRFVGPRGGVKDGPADAALIAAHGYAARPIGRRVSADESRMFHLDPKDAA